MSYNIFIHADPEFENIEHDIKKVANATLSYLNAPDGDLALVLTDDEGIQKLNREYAGVDRPTDVLSFSDGEPDLDTGRMYYGDVVLSIPCADRQAKHSGHTLGDELSLLITHGVLHLLGFEHEDEEDRQKMWSVQDEILTQVGSNIASPRQIK
jgi:probable rRNA maturation factor